MPNTGQMGCVARLRLVILLVTVSTGATGCRPSPDPPPAGYALPPGAAPVILIVADTVRADHLGLYGYDRPTTPHLDAWAAEGRVYERALATAPWTLPSFGSIYTGLWSMTHRAGVMTRGWLGSSPARLAADVPTLAEVLRDHGFVTGAVLNNPYLDPSFGVARGFDVYDHVPGDNQDIRRADVMVTRALELIDTWGSRPFFLVLHLFDPHMDYDAPEPVRGRFSARYASPLTLPFSQLGELRRQEMELTADDIEFIRAAYDEELAFVDTQIERLRAGLVARGLLRDSLVVLTSDHGEELFDHDGFEHGHALWQEVVQVPFIVWGPGVRAGREPAPVSLVDIMPTVLDWTGIELIGSVDGITLAPNLLNGSGLPARTLVVDHPLYGPRQTALVDWPRKMIVDADDRPLSVVDLDTDPAETVNVLGDRGHVVATLVPRLREMRTASARRRHRTPDETAEPDEAIVERLRALGYVR